MSLYFSFELYILNGSCTSESSKLCTYISSHGDRVIDYFAVSSDLLHQATRVVVDERVESEHMTVKLSWLTTEAHRSQAATKTNQPQITKLVWDPHKEEMVKSKLNSVSFRDKLSRASQLIQEDLNHSVEMFNSALKETVTEMTKTVRCGPSQIDKVSWFDHECRTQKRKTRRALRSFKKSRTVENKTSYIEERRNYRKLMKDKKDNKQNRLDNLLAALQDPQAFWQEIKKYKHKPPKSNIDGVTWFNHFSAVLNDATDTDDRNCDLQETTDAADEYNFDALNGDITEAEVRKALNNLKKGKAAGPDGIPNDLLKIAGDCIIQYLVELFNEIFKSGSYPSEWAKAIIQPIHKKGDTTNPDNYRGIYLLSCVSKLYTSVINSRLTQWAEDNDVLSEAQAGFRKDYSTVDHIFALHVMVSKHLKKNKKLYVAFVDFHKTFDTVKRNVPWNVLLHLGIGGNMFNTLRAMYSSVLSCVRCNPRNTDYFNCMQGLKQGCLVSPVLFSFLINELASEIVLRGKHGIQLLPRETELFLLMFADDIALLSSTPVGLQNQLNVLYEVANRLGLLVNLEDQNSCLQKWGLSGKGREMVLWK